MTTPTARAAVPFHIKQHSAFSGVFSAPGLCTFCSDHPIEWGSADPLRLDRDLGEITGAVDLLGGQLFARHLDVLVDEVDGVLHALG
jgi:hypothetical protein